MRSRARAAITILGVAWLCLASGSLAQVPPQITYQGRLTASGQPVSGTVAMTFRLYDVPSGGAPLWAETYPSVTVADGLFTVVLGSLTPISLPFDVPYFLGVTAAGDAEMTPRQPLSSAGYAMRSGIADSASINSVSGTMIVQGAITLDKLAAVCNVGDTLVQGATGWQCQSLCTPMPEVCDGKDNNCNGIVDEGWLNGGKYDRNDACGNCITDCTAIYATPNAQGICNAAGVPVCVMTCNPGYYNLNGLPSDGCEFFLDPTAIYVSTDDVSAVDSAACGGGPPGTGAGNVPCKTIGFGINRAGSTGRTKVLVADGRYGEAVTLSNGISLLGGYRPDDWDRHYTSTSTIVQGVSSTGIHDRTVVAVGVTASTVFEGFVVQGSLNTKAGGNSYAIYVSGSNANLAIRNNVIQAGRGGPGAAGVVGGNGALGVNGTGRDSDPAGYDAKIATGTGICNASNNRSFANGGSRTCGGDDVSGSNGGGNQCTPQSTCTGCTSTGCTSCTFSEFSGIDGVSGQPGNPGGAGGIGGDAGDDMVLYHSAVLGDLCYVPASKTYGLDGAKGADAAHGLGAPGCVATAGSVVGGHWVGLPALAGDSGGNGGGGGGGGAGGGSTCVTCTSLRDELGGHAGGGGSGGCGGTGGSGASAGGGAFGVFVVGGSAPVITGNILVRGEGGDGGLGGAGGQGALGGLGGSGGNGIFCADPGGRGGKGGNGGHGSGGGGGCGGVSFGIYTSGVGTPTYCAPAANNVISGGTSGPGGAGGPSLINPGGAGQPGTLGTCSFN